MVQVIDPHNCGGPGLACPGSPESKALRRKENEGRGLVLGGATCSDACHNTPPGPCSGKSPITGERKFPRPEPVPMTDEEHKKKFEEFTRAFLEQSEWDSLFPKPLGPEDELPKITMGPRPDRLKPRIPSPFSPHPLEKIEGHILPNDHDDKSA